MICVDFERERMTLADARRAFGEMRGQLDPKHADEVQEMLVEAEKEQASTTDDDGN